MGLIDNYTIDGARQIMSEMIHGHHYSYEKREPDSEGYIYYFYCWHPEIGYQLVTKARADERPEDVLNALKEHK